MLVHGHSKRLRVRRTYRIWCGMKQRCYYKGHQAYSNYGGRGIKICERWKHSYANFIKDVGKPPSKNHELDRIDTNGNYEPSNVRWATRSKNAKGRRNNRLITADGRTQNLIDWSLELGKKKYMSTIQNRIKRGWSKEDAVLTPVNAYRKKTK